MNEILSDYIKQMEKAKKEKEGAGPIHKKDLDRQIKKMQAEIRTYIKYHKLAEKVKTGGEEQT